MARRTKTLNIKAKAAGRKGMTVIWVVALFAFLLMFNRVAAFVAKAAGVPAGEIPSVAAQISDIAGNIFTGSVAIGLIWLAASVVAAPAFAITLGLIGVAFAALTVFNLMNKRGPNDFLR